MKKFMVLIFALAMVVAFSVPTYAEFTYTFKGDARMDTYSVENSKELSATNDSDRDTEWAKDNVLSRFSITAKSENIKGYIEIRPHTTSYVRHWFGEWDFGAGKLLVGKTWAPATFFTNGQNYLSNGIAGYGNLNWAAARVDQIRLTFGDLVIGLCSPPAETGPTGLAVVDYDRTIPNIEATYTLKLDPVKLLFAAGYGTYSAENAAAQDFDVDSYFLGLGALFNFGPGYANIEGHISQNGSNYGLNYASIDGGANFSAGEVKDNDGLGYLIAIGWKVNDMLKVEAGYSYVEGEDDIAGVVADNASWMYVMVPITLAPGVTLSPELGQIDQKKSAADVDQGDTTYVGATWKIAF
jgi:hypothetical protein